MENNQGLRSLLKIAFFYSLLQRLVGKPGAVKRVSDWRGVKKGMKVVDIGCGPGTILDTLPSEIDYLGLDISEQYIERAKTVYGNRARFYTGISSDYLENQDFSDADVIICNCVMHHLTDSEVGELFTFINKNIKKGGGRFFSLEPTHLLHQSFLSTWVMNQDRGLYIRTERQWKSLIQKYTTGNLETLIVTDLAWIPYKHIVIECKY